MKDEALRLALEAMESKYIVNCGAWRVQQDQAIAAIKQALEQPEPEPVALAKHLALNLDGVIADVEQGDGFDDVCLDTIKFVRDSLYTSPQEFVCSTGLCHYRESQSLADEEIIELWPGLAVNKHVVPFARAIEAMLKEKNQC